MWTWSAVGTNVFLRSLIFFRSSVLDHPFWSARFEPPVFGPPVFGPPVLDRPFWTACLGQPIYWYNSAPPAARYLEVPRYLMAPGTWGDGPLSTLLVGVKRIGVKRKGIGIGIIQDIYSFLIPETE